MNNYPLFYKLQVVSTYLNTNITVVNIKYLYKICKSTLFNWINLYKQNKLNNKKKYKKRSKFTLQIKRYIKKYVIRRINFKYKLLIKQIKLKFKKIISKSSIYNILKELKITKKKKKIRKKRIYGDRNKLKEKIIKFKNKVKDIDKNNIISIDEVGFNTTICSDYGWGPIGKRIYIEINSSWIRYTVICAVSNKKIITTKIIKGSAYAVHFLDFLKNNLSNLNNKYLLLDNSRIHHAKIVKEYMNTSSNKLLFNVPYYPEFNPIE